MQRLTILVCLAALPASTAAGASASKQAEPARAGTARELLAAIAKGEGNAGDQSRRIAELSALSPTPVDALVSFLGRERATSQEARREVLAAIGAAVPDSRGRFKSPGRESKKTKEEADKFDWAAAILETKQSRATREALADIAAIRALALSRDPRGALAALEFGFTEAGLIYRDEVGRYLRKGSPWSIPGLIRGAHAKTRDMRRYATYQLERLDRQAPHKAVRAAEISETLWIEVFNAFADTLYREAIYVVLDNVDHHVDTLRAAARKTLDIYVTTDPPRPPPKRRLTQAGGDLTKKPVPLYLSHKQLADIELRRRLEKLTGTAPAKDATLAELKDAFYKYYDQERAAALMKVYDAGRAAAESGDLAAAIARFDEVLSQDPEHSKRAEMAPVYLRYGDQMLESHDNKAAVVALTKAHKLDPGGKLAKQAEAKAHLARARLIEAAGGDAAAEIAMARELDPDAGVEQGPQWMLFLGIGGALAGVFLLLAGALIRRRR